MKTLCLLLLSCSALATDMSATRIKASWDISSVTHTAWGTCFAISDTEILTAYHTVDKGKIEIEVDGKFIEAKLEKFDAALDFALIKTTTKHGLPILKLRKTEMEMQVSFKSAPMQLTSGILKGFTLQLSFTIGASGSPVFQDGEVVGMVMSGSEIKNYETYECSACVCASSASILDFLKK